MYKTSTSITKYSITSPPSVDKYINVQRKTNHATARSTKSILAHIYDFVKKF